MSGYSRVLLLLLFVSKASCLAGIDWPWTRQSALRRICLQGDGSSLQFCFYFSLALFSFSFWFLFLAGPFVASRSGRFGETGETARESERDKADLRLFGLFVKKEQGAGLGQVLQIFWKSNE